LTATAAREAYFSLWSSQGLRPVGMVEYWNIGKMGFGILKYWVYGIIVFTIKLKWVKSFKIPTILSEA
jgi:hypothetical protein